MYNVVILEAAFAINLFKMEKTDKPLLSGMIY